MTLRTTTGRTASLAVAGAAILALAACGKTFMLATARSGEIKGTAAERDVRRTQNYLANFQNIRTVGFRAPDTCFSQTAGQATGVTQQAGTILTTACAVWLAELERAVSVEGYRVISWDVLLRAERTGSGSIYDAAKKLGADLVFILNSLEAVPVIGGANSATTFSYYHADQRGNPTSEFLLSDEQRKMLGGYMVGKLNLIQQQNQVMALSAVLDTTAILASTAESVWYYRWGVTKPVGDQAGTNFLFRGRGMYWRPVEPATAKTRVMSSSGVMSSKDVIVGSVSATAASAYQAELFALVRSVAKDFVVNFRVGAH